MDSDVVGARAGLVCANTGAGRTADALRWAQGFDRNRDFMGAFIFHDPLLAPLQAEPGFAEFKRRMNFP